jgi:membrane protease subunit (stomatin/prohibitin family)
VELGQKIAAQLAPAFAELGLALDTFVVQNLSLPEELQKRLNERIGMTMLGDMGRYTQFQVAQSMPIAAANEGGGAAGIGAGLGAGMVMAQSMMGAMRAPGAPGPEPSTPAIGAPVAPAPGGGVAPAAGAKFCIECGKPMPGRAKFCPECGGAQQ